jgi:DUF4097 and DUF4098 domain-containing protein YvlB
MAIGLAASVAVNVDAQRSRSGSGRNNSGDTETVNKTVSLPANGTVRLRTFSGRVHITGTSGRDVTITAVRKADRDVLDHVHLTIDTSGSTVSIDANDKDRGWSRNRNDGDVVQTDFEIEMPASASLDVNGFSSPVVVTNVTGDQRLETFSGTITVSGAKGSVDAHTFNADVDVDLVAAGATPNLDAHTFSGSIRAKLADTARADVQFNSFSGQFDSDLPLTMRSSRRGRVAGHFGSGSDSSSAGATLKFETFSGDVRVVK